MRSFLARIPRVPLLGALLGLIWFLARFGLPALSFTNIDWLMEGDWNQHALGFLHFRISPWGFPLGKISTITAPVGTNIAFTDSNPWVSLLLKPFSGILPTDFQFIGPWLCLSFMLQGVAGVWLGQRITQSKIGAILAAAFFVTSPVLDNRVGHPTLCAHYLLLFAFILHVVPEDQSFLARRRNLLGLGLVALTAGIHPTLCLMILAVILALVIQQVITRRLTWLGGALHTLTLLGVTLFVWRILGIIGGNELREAGGLGYYNADLATLVHPLDGSRLIPRLPSHAGAYEGLGYLGLGAIALGLFLPGLALAHAQESWAKVRAHLVLMVLCLLLALLAFSIQWRVFGTEILNLDTLTKPLRPILDPLRSSGRFIWPVHYLLLVAILFASWRFMPLPRWALVALWVACLALQMGDAKRNAVPAKNHRADWYHMQDEVLAPLAQGKTKLALHPIMLWSNGPGCDADEWPRNIFQQALYFAYRHRLAMNGGYIARSSKQHQQACEDFPKTIAEGKFAKDTLYLVHPRRVADIVRWPEMECHPAGPDTFGCVLK